LNILEHPSWYRIPDQFSWQDGLLNTSTDKIDTQRLKEMH
jgi:hypothetical protein